MTHPNRKLFTVFTVFVLIASFLHADDAEARRRRRTHPRKPRYRRALNVAQCQAYSWRPSEKSVPGGRAANARVPFHTNKVHNYLVALNAVGCGLIVNSTFRDCVTNRGVGGAQKSRHLCGSGADTSGCSKAIASRVCRQQGMTYIEEGRGKFPHCQAVGFCNQLQRD